MGHVAFATTLGQTARLAALDTAPTKATGSSDWMDTEPHDSDWLSKTPPSGEEDEGLAQLLIDISANFAILALIGSQLPNWLYM